MADPTSAQVLSIVANIKSKDDITSNDEKLDHDEVTSTCAPTKKGNKQKDVIKGKPKSGKFWKSSRERFSTVNKTKGLKQDFQKKTALRLELKKTKDLAKQALEEINQTKLERKERRRQNLKRAEENKRKSEIVQVITNTTKLKRMRKKQLRFIQKRDTNKEVEASK